MTVCCRRWSLQQDNEQPGSLHGGWYLSVREANYSGWVELSVEYRTVLVNMNWLSFPGLQHIHALNIVHLVNIETVINNNKYFYPDLLGRTSSQRTLSVKTCRSSTLNLLILASHDDWPRRGIFVWCRELQTLSLRRWDERRNWYWR